MKNKKILLNILAISLAAFGLATLFMSSSIFLDLFNIRQQEGNYVLLVVWANWICSLLYLGAAYGFIRQKTWAAGLLFLSAGILLIAIIGLMAHINSGGLYETKTIFALIFRILLTLGFAFAARWLINSKEKYKK